MIKKTLSLKHEFSESEINEIAHTLTECLQKKGAVVLEKQQVNRTLNANIKYWDKQIDDQSTLISKGYEYRDIDCEVTYNHPIAGQKTLQRLDTYESWAEPMTMDEFDLFNVVNVPTQFDDDNLGVDPLFQNEAQGEPIIRNIVTGKSEEE